MNEWSISRQEKGGWKDLGTNSMIKELISAKNDVFSISKAKCSNL